MQRQYQKSEAREALTDWEFVEVFEDGIMRIRTSATKADAIGFTRGWFVTRKLRGNSAVTYVMSNGFPVRHFSVQPTTLSEGVPGVRKYDPEREAYNLTGKSARIS